MTTIGTLRADIEAKPFRMRRSARGSILARIAYFFRWNATPAEDAIGDLEDTIAELRDTIEQQGDQLAELREQSKATLEMMADMFDAWQR